MNTHAWIFQHLPSAPVIIEAGVCDGTDTDRFAKMYPRGRIYGFEPVPSLFEQAKLKNKDNQNVQLFEQALGETRCTKTIFISDINGCVSASSSIMKPKDLSDNPHVTFKNEMEVDVINLDEWCEENGVNHVDLMWLDIQGMEPQVIMASPKIVARTDFIFTEVSLKDTYEGVIKYDEFRTIMDKLGFDVVFEDLPWKDMGNVMFKRRTTEN